MREKGRELLVGVVFLSLMVALGVLTLTLGRDVFRATEDLAFRFRNVAGLTKGADVWINGLPAGTVQSIEIGSDGVLTATARMHHPVSGIDLGTGAEVVVKSKSALGGAVISIETGKGAKAAKSLDELVARTWESRKDPFEAVGEKIEDLSGDFKGALQEVQEFFSEVRRGKGLLAKVVGDEKVAADFEALLGNLKGASDDIAAGRGTLGLLLKDDSLYRKAEGAVAGLEEMARSAREGDGLLARLLTDKGTAERFDRITGNLDRLLEDLRGGRGTFGKLMTDETLYQRLAASAEDLAAFTRQVNEGGGLLHRLAWDETLGEDFSRTLADLRSMFADIRAGKGTLGRLMTDEELYADVRDAVRSLKRSFEEGRENAPILTFAGFLFKTF